MSAVRIVFTKSKRTRFSHLDLVRCFTRIFSRAGHSRQPYAGVQSASVYGLFTAAFSRRFKRLRDSRHQDRRTDERGRDKTQNAPLLPCPADIRIADAYEDGEKLNLIDNADYELTVPENCVSGLKNFISQDRIEIEKKSEKRRNEDEYVSATE